MQVSSERLHLAIVSPFDRGWAGDAREHYFGPVGAGTAPPLLLAGEAILTLGAYRDISGMWLRAGDLFNEKTNEELAKADSNLTTFFGGKDFGEDILGALDPRVQIVVTRQEFAAGQPTPAIRLPAFALAAELKDPATMQPELRRTFQSLVGFLNIIGAMNGQPQLDQEQEKNERGQLIVARYLRDAKTKDLGLKIHYNFSPTVAFAGRRFIVSSTEQLARQLVTQAVDARPAGDADRVLNSDAVFRFQPLRDILADNRSQLVAQNMLEQGHTKEEAERDVAALLELIGWLDQAALKLDTTAKSAKISLDVALKSLAGGAP
jgi:hypothetical protein